MGKARSAKRKLSKYRVAVAEKTQRAKHELAMKMVAERVKIDAEFAAEVLKIAGETLRPEIKKDALETIASHNGKIVEGLVKTGEIDGVPVLGTPDENPESVQFHTETLEELKGTGALLDNPPELSPDLAQHIKTDDKDCALDDPPVWKQDN